MSANVSSTLVLLVAVLVAGLGVWQLGQAGQIVAKAWLSEALLEEAWEQSLHSGEAVKPWPWADTWPVARLTVPRLELQRYVLAGDAGHALAFGAGLVSRQETLSEASLLTIAGHRDTHFAFLRDLQAGDRVVLETVEGSRSYRIRSSLVTQVPEVQVRSGDRATLLLVTCYPFDALSAGGDQRYVLLADLESAI